MKNEYDEILLNFSKLCPYIKPAIKSNNINITYLTKENFNNYLLFQKVLFYSKKLLEDSEYLSSCLIIIEPDNNFDLIWNEIEWIHFILKKTFSSKSILFGKFSKSNFPSNFIGKNTIMFVIRKSNIKIDKKFIKKNCIKNEIIKEFNEKNTISGYSIEDIYSDLDLSKKIYRVLKNDLISG
jgi:hypothetical protein